MSAKLVAKRKELDAKRKELRNVWDDAGEDLDFSKPTVLEALNAADSAEAVQRVRERNREIDELFDEVEDLAELVRARDNLDRPLPDVGGVTHPASAGAVVQGLGDLIVGHEEFRSFLDNPSDRSFSIEGWGHRELRATLLESTTGVPVENVRSGRLVEAATRPIQVLDIIPGGQTSGNAYIYMEETLRTHSAAEMREGATYAEDAYKWTQRTEPVSKIGTSIPVTDEQLEDVPGLQSYLNSRLTFGLRQRFDSQVLVGNGTPPNVSGITDRSGIQTQALGGDTVPDAVYKAIVKVRVTGRAMPTHYVTHPNDWQDVRLLKTADGIYIWGSPSEAGPERIWGLPVVQADSLTENTGLVADTSFCQALDRRGVDVQVGYSGTQFVEGKRTIRADLRVAFAVYRAAAFCTVTGI